MKHTRFFRKLAAAALAGALMTTPCAAFVAEIGEKSHLGWEVLRAVEADTGGFKL